MRVSETLSRWAPTVLAVLCAGIFLGLLCSIPRGLDPATTSLVRGALVQGSTHFAIADFDGDQQPDLATIRVARDGVHTSEYSLELQFSTGPRPAIGFFGPAGGLQISPQDVNGDKFTDLVITSSLDANFVAILLNDGRGHFTQAERSKYPNIGRPTASYWQINSVEGIREFALGQGKELFGDDSETAAGTRPIQNSISLPWNPLEAIRDISGLLETGRAPPNV